MVSRQETILQAYRRTYEFDEVAGNLEIIICHQTQFSYDVSSGCVSAGPSWVK